MKFLNRWRIEGTLTTKTSLRIGSGDLIPAKVRLSTTYIKEDTEINTIATAQGGKPYIPGSAIKGNLRAWAMKNIKTDEKPNGLFAADEINIIFGSDVPTEDDAVAGKVQFGNAYLSPEPEKAGFSQLPDWHTVRLTAVSASIAVDRFRRTASRQKLFFQEYVPSGIAFAFRISGNDYGESEIDPPDNAFLKKMVLLLEGFNCFQSPVCIGAETGLLEKGWGRLTWALRCVKRTNRQGIADWIETQRDQDEFIAERDFPFHCVEHTGWLEEAQQKLNTLNENPRIYTVELQCLDAFLVSDPASAKRKEDKGQKDRTEIRADHAPLRNEDGYAVLPKSSFKGAFRSQAERILRTIATDAKVNEAALVRVACYPDHNKKEMKCGTVRNKDDVKTLCFACRLFGASGWKSVFSCTDFVGFGPEGETAPPFKRREFVAIDRFTGGVSGSGKFDADVADRPTLKGEIGFDLHRLGADQNWAVGLLALTIRDLVEGDIRIGFGRAKGFGEIRARLEGKSEISEILNESVESLSAKVKTLVEKIANSMEVKDNVVS